MPAASLLLVSPYLLCARLSLFARAFKFVTEILCPGRGAPRPSSGVVSNEAMLTTDCLCSREGTVGRDMRLNGGRCRGTWSCRGSWTDDPDKGGSTVGNAIDVAAVALDEDPVGEKQRREHSRIV